MFRGKGFRVGGLGFIGDMLGKYWDNGKDNGNYYLRFRVAGFRVWGLGFGGVGFGVWAWRLGLVMGLGV